MVKARRVGILILILSFAVFSKSSRAQFVPLQFDASTIGKYYLAKCPQSGAQAPAKITTALCGKLNSCLADESYNGFACAIRAGANQEVGGALGLDNPGSNYRESITGIMQDIRLGRVAVDDSKVCTCLAAIQNMECGQVTASFSPANNYAEPQDLISGLAECRDTLTLAKPFKAMAAGAAQYYLLKYDGNLLAWGENERGELGDGSTIQRDEPVQLALGNVSNIFALFNSLGTTRVFIVKRDGSVWAWGNNERYLLGPGELSLTSPILVPGLSHIKDIVDGFGYLLALNGNGTVSAWGNNHHGQLGDGTTASRNAPSSVVGLTDVVAIAGNYGSSYAVKRDGSVWKWGMAMSGERPVPVTSPVQVPELQNIRSVWISPASYYGPHFALNSEGTPIAWWEPGSPDSRPPVKILLTAETPFKNNIKLFGLGGGPLALNADGKIYAIQYRFGEYVTYVYLPEFTNVADIYGGAAPRTDVSNYFFVKKDGSLWKMTDSGGLPTAVDL